MHAFNTPVILIPQSREKNPCSRKVDKQLPRFFAEFTLSQLRRFFASLRMTGEGLRMTARDLFTASGAWYLPFCPLHFFLDTPTTLR